MLLQILSNKSAHSGTRSFFPIEDLFCINVSKKEKSDWLFIRRIMIYNLTNYINLGWYSVRWCMSCSLEMLSISEPAGLLLISENAGKQIIFHFQTSLLCMFMPTKEDKDLWIVNNSGDGVKRVYDFKNKLLLIRNLCFHLFTPAKCIFYWTCL